MKKLLIIAVSLVSFGACKPRTMNDGSVKDEIVESKPIDGPEKLCFIVSYYPIQNKKRTYKVEMQKLEHLADDAGTQVYSYSFKTNVIGNQVIENTNQQATFKNDDIKVMTRISEGRDDGFLKLSNIEMDEHGNARTGVDLTINDLIYDRIQKKVVDFNRYKYELGNFVKVQTQVTPCQN